VALYAVDVVFDIPTDATIVAPDWLANHVNTIVDPVYIFLIGLTTLVNCTSFGLIIDHETVNVVSVNKLFS
jgi:hypothetical protein